MAGVAAIFWDNDGVLLDTEKLNFRATREILLPLGVELTAAQYAECYLACGRGAWHLVPGLDEEAVRALRQRRNVLHLKYLQEAAAVQPGVLELLAALAGRVRMGVVTTSTRRCFDAAHARSGLRPYFDFILTREDYAREKPAPDPYVAAIRLSGCRAEQCLVIEDSLRGVQAAKAAGLRCCALRTDFCRDAGFPGADAVLDCLADLPAVLNSWGAGPGS